MKWFFLGKTNKNKYGAIVDIGSGSVGIAIVKSDQNAEKPEIIWTHREYTATPKKFDYPNGLKRIETALLQAFLLLGNKGIRTLHKLDATARLSEVQVSISAPWCNTITDTITTDFDKKTAINKKILKEIILKAKEKADQLLTEETKRKLNTTPISMSVIDVNLNGYHVQNSVGKKADRMTLSIVRAFTDKELVKSSQEAAEKTVPNITINLNSFMYSYYECLRFLAPDTSEVCLIDVTHEATELGVVRENVLEHVTHMELGISTIAREISELTKVPIEEAYGYVKSNGTDLDKSLSKTKQEQLEKIISNFETKLAELLQKTGDQLSIPKTIFLHTDSLTEEFFTIRVKNAAKLATKSNHNVHTVTAKYFSDNLTSDTALLVSAYVFHKNLDESRRLVE